MAYSLRRVDPSVREYLSHARSLAAENCGVLVPRSGPSVVGRAVVALAALGVLYFISQPADALDAGPQRVLWQSLLGGVAILSAAWAFQIARSRKGGVGTFLFADGRHLWEVADDTVEVVSLRGVRDADGRHHYSNGAYQRTDVTVDLRDSRMHMSFASRAGSEEFVRFVSFLGVLQRPCENGEPSALAEQPEVAAAVACRLAHGENDFNVHSLTPGPAPPDMEDQPHGGTRRTWLPFLIGAVSGGLCFLLFPTLNTCLHDEHLFAKSHRAHRENLKPLQDYLAAYPADGRHTREVKERLDDLHFDLAKDESQRQHSPRSLRTYLADAAHQRHRDEAQGMINGYYDEAIKRLKDLAAAKGNAVDPKLFGGLLALLEALKVAQDPVITVGFAATHHVKPETKEQRDLETELAALRETAEPELKRIRQQRGTTLIEPGSTFDADNIARREAVILGALRDALKKVLEADLLTLEAARKDAEPILTVGYAIFADGGNYLYTTNEERQFAPEVKKIVGLLRGYKMTWTITFKPAGVPEPLVYRTDSNPGQQLRLNSTGGEPDWAPYAVMLYSGFHEMSRSLIRSMALEPPAAITAMTFAQATGK